MANCNHDCNSCKSTCSKKDFLAPMNAHSHVKKVIGVVSGKGGVGKSSVTSLLALAKQREGYKVAILDGDITGPSIGRIFGVENKQVLSNGKEFTPVESSQGIKIMSTNLLLESNDTPVIWRGPVLAGMIKQFWSDVMWGDVEAKTVKEGLERALEKVLKAEEMIAATSVECGNYRDLSLFGAKEYAKYVLDKGFSLNIYGE